MIQDLPGLSELCILLYSSLDISCVHRSSTFSVHMVVPSEGFRSPENGSKLQLCVHMILLTRSHRAP